MKHFLPWIASLLLSSALFAQAPDSAAKPGARLHDRPHAVMAELGWNGLSGGVGAIYSHYFPGTPHVADLGFGLGITGGRAGLRYRYLFVPRKRTSPFLGAGLNYAGGMGGADFKVNADKDTLTVKVNPTANLLFNLGLDLKANNGFVFVPSIGWGIDLMEDDYDVVSGVETRRHRQLLRLFLKGGFQISFITGWSF